jgi:hypothetical protein
VALLVLAATPAAASGPEGIPIPRSMPGDRGKYFLLSSERTGTVVRTLHARVGPDVVGYTRAETDCASMMMREIGYSEEAPQAIREAPGRWFELVPGSSKGDLAAFVCR